MRFRAGLPGGPQGIRAFHCFRKAAQAWFQIAFHTDARVSAPPGWPRAIGGSGDFRQGFPEVPWVSDGFLWFLNADGSQFLGGFPPRTLAGAGAKRSGGEGVTVHCLLFGLPWWPNGEGVTPLWCFTQKPGFPHRPSGPRTFWGFRRTPAGVSEGFRGFPGVSGGFWMTAHAKFLEASHTGARVSCGRAGLF